jgi:hypothetical protein
MDLQLRFIQPTFLSGVLIYDDEQGSFINCVASNYYSGIVLVKIALKTKKNCYYLNRIIYNATSIILKLFWEIASLLNLLDTFQNKILKQSE